MDAESEDVVEDSLDEIDEGRYDSTSTEARTCVLPRFVAIIKQGFGSTFPVSVLLTPILAPKPLALTL